MWRTILFSVLVIIIIQYSFQYIKDALTPHKTKDVIGFNKQKFDDIIRELRETRNNPEPDPESELLEFAHEQINCDNIINE